MNVLKKNSENLKQDVRIRLIFIWVIWNILVFEGKKWNNFPMLLLMRDWQVFRIVSGLCCQKWVIFYLHSCKICAFFTTDSGFSGGKWGKLWWREYSGQKVTQFRTKDFLAVNFRVKKNLLTFPQLCVGLAFYWIHQAKMGRCFPLE